MYIPCFNCACLLCFFLWGRGYRHAQALAALQAYSHWLAQFYSEVQSQNQSQFLNLITSTIDASSPLITAKVARLVLYLTLIMGQTETTVAWFHVAIVVH